MQTPEPTPPATPSWAPPGAPGGPYSPAQRPARVAPVPPPPAWGYAPPGSPVGPPRHYYPPAGTTPPRPPKRHRGVTSMAYALTVLVVLTYFFGGSSLTRAGEALIGRAPASAGPANGVGATFNAIMAAQGTALVAGDREKYLGYVDHAVAGGVDAFARMYDNLRQMHVTMWHAEATSGDVPVDADRTYTVNVAYCLVVTPCSAPLYVIVRMEAAVVGDHVLLERLVPPTPSASDHDPRPWLTDQLTAAVGNRVVVAAPSQYASRVNDILAIAQKAIRTDDQLARWGKPSVYILYLASSADATTWFDARLENVAGYAANISNTDIEAVAIVPYASDVGEGGMTALIMHEFAHVATLQNDDNDGTDSFIEGIAEYAAYRDHPSWAKWRYADIRKFVRGKWNGHVLLTAEMSSDVPGVTSAAYGIGYLALKRIADKYGQDKMLDFWGRLEQGGMSVETASLKSLGVAWSKVNADCAAYVRTTVGA